MKSQRPEWTLHQKMKMKKIKKDEEEEEDEDVEEEERIVLVFYIISIGAKLNLINIIRELILK